MMSTTTTTSPIHPTTTVFPTSTVPATTTTSTQPPTSALRLRLLALKVYRAGGSAVCLTYGYLGLLVELTSLNAASGIAPPGPWSMDNIQAGPPCTTTGCEHEMVACTGSVVSVSDDVRRDFFDYVFPVFTTDPSAGQLCANISEVPPNGKVQCTLFMGSSPTNSGRLFYEREQCGAQVFFGCPIASCLPLPVSDEGRCFRSGPSGAARGLM
jgi:hypothetical protein